MDYVTLNDNVMSVSIIYNVICLQLKAIEIGTRKVHRLAGKFDQSVNWRCLLQLQENASHSRNVLGVLVAFWVEVAGTCYSLPFVSWYVLITFLNKSFFGLSGRVLKLLKYNMHVTMIQFGIGHAVVTDKTCRNAHTIIPNDMWLPWIHMLVAMVTYLLASLACFSVSS